MVLELNADSTEFCPNNDSSLLAVGTYELQSDRSTRLGKIYLYSLTDSDQTSSNPPCDSATGSSYSLTTLAVTDTSGIFDLKWRAEESRRDGGGVLAAALADGTVRLYECSSPELSGCSGATANNACMSEMSSCQALSSGMALSVAWDCSSQGGDCAVKSASSAAAVSAGGFGFQDGGVAGDSCSSNCLLAASGSDGHVSVMQVCLLMSVRVWGLYGDFGAAA